MEKFYRFFIFLLCICMILSTVFTCASAFNERNSGPSRSSSSGFSHGSNMGPQDRGSFNQSWEQSYSTQTQNQGMFNRNWEQSYSMQPQHQETNEQSFGQSFQMGPMNQNNKTEPPAKPEGDKPGSNNDKTEYTAANTVTENSVGESYSSSDNGENAVLVSGSNVTISNATVNKTGSSSGDSADFYGTNAAVLAADGSNLTIEGTTVTTDGGHANGVFSYGNGTVVNVSDTTITTSGNNSGGLMTTGGATLNAENVTVSTSGNSSAAIRSDRGGGTVSVNGGSYSASGVGSPAIYSTADITVSNATLNASSSEAVVIEGGNSVTLYGVDITGNNSRLNGQSTVNTNVLIYQSMSGDASEGNSTFNMSGGTMTAETGAMFHVTNVTTEINLDSVVFNYASDSNVFLSATADAWGKSGSNGGNVTLNLTNQTIVGAIVSDSSSSVSVNLGENSTWKLTGDSSITNFTGDLANVDLNGYTLIINGVAVTA